jgi:hypothetical protein
LILFLLLRQQLALSIFWIVVCFANIINLFAIISGWKKSVLLLDEKKIVICQPSGWRGQTNLIINLYEINHLEIKDRNIIIGRIGSLSAAVFGPLVKINKLKEQLRRFLPKFVL